MPATTTSALRRGWDIIADQPPAEVVLRFSPAVADRVREATWHPTQAVRTDADGSLHWRATVSGTIEIRLWILSWGDDVEVLDADDIARRRGRDAPTSGSPLRGGVRMRRFAGLALGLAVLFANVPAASAATNDSLEHLILDQVNAARVQQRAGQASRVRRPVGPRRRSRQHDGLAQRAHAHRRGLAQRESRGAAHQLVRPGRDHRLHVGSRSDRTAAKAARDAVAEQPGALGAADEQPLQLRRRRAGLPVVERAPVRVGRADRIEGPFAGPSLGHRRDTDAATTSSGRGTPTTSSSRPTPPVCATSRSRCGVTAAGWVTILAHTTTTSRLSPNKVHGHWYGLRVRATDNKGNVGAWSAERRVWVP